MKSWKDVKNLAFFPKLKLFWVFWFRGIFSGCCMEFLVWTTCEGGRTYSAALRCWWGRSQDRNVGMILALEIVAFPNFQPAVLQRRFWWVLESRVLIQNIWTEPCDEVHMREALRQPKNVGWMWLLQDHKIQDIEHAHCFRLTKFAIAEHLCLKE